MSATKRMSKAVETAAVSSRKEEEQRKHPVAVKPVEEDVEYADYDPSDGPDERTFMRHTEYRLPARRERAPRDREDPRENALGKTVPVDYCKRVLFQPRTLEFKRFETKEMFVKRAGIFASILYHLGTELRDVRLTIDETFFINTSINEIRDALIATCELYAKESEKDTASARTKLKTQIARMNATFDKCKRDIESIV